MVAFSVLNIIRLHDACGKSFNALKLLLLSCIDLIWRIPL